MENTSMFFYSNEEMQAFEILAFNKPRSSIFSYEGFFFLGDLDLNISKACYVGKLVNEELVGVMALTRHDISKPLDENGILDFNDTSIPNFVCINWVETKETQRGKGHLADIYRFLNELDLNTTFLTATPMTRMGEEVRINEIRKRYVTKYVQRDYEEVEASLSLAVAV